MLLLLLLFNILILSIKLLLLLWVKSLLLLLLNILGSQNWQLIIVGSHLSVNLLVQLTVNSIALKKKYIYILINNNNYFLN